MTVFQISLFCFAAIEMFTELVSFALVALPQPIPFLGAAILVGPRLKGHDTQNRILQLDLAAA